jgi:chromosome segregation ATPase
MQMSDTPRTDKLERECNQRKADWNKACDEQGWLGHRAKAAKLENELEVMTCRAVGWQNQAELNANLLVECREKAERYRLEANAMMAQRDEAQRKVAELQAGLDDIEEYGTEEINAAVDLRHQLAAALVERDELKSEKEANYQCLLMLERDLYKAREERDKAISVADELIEYAHECLAKLESWGQGYKRYEDDMDRIREDIAAYNMMKEALK